MNNEDRLLFVLSNVRCLQIYMYSKFDKFNPDQNKLNEYIINQKENLELLKEIFLNDKILENKFV